MINEENFSYHSQLTSRITGKIEPIETGSKRQVIKDDKSAESVVNSIAYLLVTFLIAVGFDYLYSV